MGNSNHFIELTLEGRLSNRAAIGAIVKCFSGELTQLRQVEGGKGTSNQNSLTLHFGLASNTIVDSIEIIWPGSGTVDKYQNLSADNFYRAVENEGIYFTGITQTDKLIPSFKLHRIYPNPFNSTLKIDYSIGLGAEVDISVYNIYGQKVRAIFSGYVNAGEHLITWDAKNDTGVSLPSGIYILYFKLSNSSKSKRVLYIK